MFFFFFTRNGIFRNVLPFVKGREVQVSSPRLWTREDGQWWIFSSSSSPSNKIFSNQILTSTGRRQVAVDDFWRAGISEIKKRRKFCCFFCCYFSSARGRGQWTRRVSSCETIQLIWNPWAWWRIGRRWDAPDAAPDAAPDHQPPVRDR